jgi:hypothetical protein
MARICLGEFPRPPYCCAFSALLLTHEWLNPRLHLRSPPPPTVGGIVFSPVPTDFPAALTAPEVSKAATLTPYPEAAATIFAPLEGTDIVASVLLGVALWLGPDFALAPAGLVSSDGIRPGFALEGLAGNIITPDDQWLRDRREKLAAAAPPLVRAVVFVPFVAGGLLLNRLLLVALEDQSFVLSLGVISCFGGGLLELIREPRPTRAERDRKAALEAEFVAFSAARLERGGRCHESEIVSAFRQFYPRYRRRDMGRTDDGISVADKDIGALVRSWNARMGRPGERSTSGYWKGISVARARPPSSSTTDTPAPDAGSSR